MVSGITLSKSLCPLTQDERTHMSVIPYASAIRSIMYVMLCTILDVSYALRVTSRYQFNLSEGHRVTVKNILYYLRRTKKIFLIKGDGNPIVRYQMLL